MDILSVNTLTKRFGTFTAVDGISFALKKGEILGLLGPNGAGKTTTIQMLLAVLEPTEGEIRYFGHNLASHREEVLEQVNFSSTYTNLPWNLTVQENLTYISYLYSIQNRKAHVDKVIEIFKLTTLLNQPMYELSAGQLTRVNLAKAFINQPKILLLDEPTASLDPDIAQYIRDFLLEEREKSNISIIFTSHNMPEVENICDRVLFINQGKIIADDTPVNLAKSLDFARIQLMVRKEHKTALKKYCDEKNLPITVEGAHVTIEVKEKNIPTILQDIMGKSIAFDEISIEKPTLEDYFIHNARKQEKSFEKII